MLYIFGGLYLLGVAILVRAFWALGDREPSWRYMAETILGVVAAIAGIIGLLALVLKAYLE